MRKNVDFDSENGYETLFSYKLYVLIRLLEKSLSKITCEENSMRKSLIFGYKYRSSGRRQDILLQGDPTYKRYLLIHLHHHDRRTASRYTDFVWIVEIKQKMMKLLVKFCGQLKLSFSNVNLLVF